MDNKYKSISSVLREMSANRNSELRKKVVNVARPDDADPTSEKSKLAKQAEIKTKIIDEEKQHGLYKYNKRSGIWDHQRSVTPETKDQWLNQYKKDEPDHHFVVSKNKPTHNPLKEEAIDEVIGDVGPNQGPLDEITVGDTVHAGFGTKGGAGFKGKVHKVDGDDIHINIGKGKYGDRIVKAPKRLVTKEETVVEASVSAIDKDDIEANKKDVDAPEIKDKKKDKKSDTDAVDAKEIKGGKTEIELNPRTNDNNVDQDKEDGESKKARKAANKEIGTKGMKEETTMLKSDKSFGLPQGLLDSVKKVLDEKLIGNQHKIDANKNGEIDAHDFKLLKSKKKVAKEEVEQIDEKIMASDYEATSEKSKSGHRPKVVHKSRGTTMYLGSTSYKTAEHARGHASAYLSGYAERGDKHATTKGHEYQKKNAQHIAEEVEQVEEGNIENKEKKNAAIEKIGFERMKKTGAFPGQSPKRTGRAVTKEEAEVEFSEAELARIEAIAKDME